MKTLKIITAGVILSGIVAWIAGGDVPGTMGVFTILGWMAYGIVSIGSRFLPKKTPSK
ncbi:MAG: hypothetical protein AABW68_02640 [archaeon]